MKTLLKCVLAASATLLAAGAQAETGATMKTVQARGVLKQELMFVPARWSPSSVC